MDELASKVPVGEWINIDNFSLTGVGRTYRTTNNPLKMNFIHKTDISESTLRIENNFLDLVDFETILSGKPDENILIGKSWFIYLQLLNYLQEIVLILKQYTCGFCFRCNWTGFRLG